MQALLLGVVLLVIILLAGRAYVKADPKRLAWLMRRVGGSLALAGALAMVVTGRVVLALPLAMLGFWLLGRRFPFGLPGGADDVWTQTGQSSSVRTPMLEMTLDHASGGMDGMVLAGSFSGRRLSGLNREELLALYEECVRLDAQGAQLLQAYMERIGVRQEQAGAGGGRRGNGAAMTVEEAYDILGLKPGATPEDIQQAHRSLMKKYHPDQGGSTYLAAKINEAKDVLLRHV
jgi:hypothetical protein